MRLLSARGASCALRAGAAAATVAPTPGAAVAAAASPRCLCRCTAVPRRSATCTATASLHNAASSAPPTATAASWPRPHTRRPPLSLQHSLLPGARRRASVTSHAGAAAAAAGSGGGGGGASGAAGSWPPALEQWLVQHGGTVNGVELRQVLYPSGATDRQLVATADHAPGALLVSVPARLQVRYDAIEAAAAAPTRGATAGAATTAAEPAVVSSAAAAAAESQSATEAPSPSPPPSRPGDGPFAIPAADAAAMVALYNAMPRGSDSGAPAWQFKQALTLLYHLSRGHASPLLPYLAHLPGVARGVPPPRVAMLLYDDAVQEMQYGELVQNVRNQQYWLRTIADGVLAHLGPPPGAASPAAAPAPAPADGGSSSSGGGSGGASASSPPAAAQQLASPFGGLPVDGQLFAWAVSVATSRCFGLARFRTNTCVPLVDMANHVAPRSAAAAEIRSGPEGEVVMYARRQIVAGEELTLGYGTHDNHNLLLSYGFTLQPNPYDAFFFDLDLDTLTSLVEGLGEGSAAESGAPTLAEWQLRLLADKLGLGPAPPSAPTDIPSAAAADAAAAAAEPAAAADAADAAATTAAAARSKRVFFAAAPPPDGDGDGSGTVVRQAVDPRLLAAVRIATLTDPVWARTLDPMTGEQVGEWRVPMARQHEVMVMRLLAALATAIYQSFPTTIQQDRALLSSVSRDVAAAAAAVTLTAPDTQQAAPPAAAAPGGGGGAAGAGGGGGWALRPVPLYSGVELSGGGGGGGDGDVSAAAVAAHTRDMAEAIRFRLGLKNTLERSLQAIIARAKELDAPQTAR